jgi:hypothetical protein
MIDLDNAIPYHPPVPLPPKPFQHAECIPPSSKGIPSLTHLLPQRPIPQTAPPEQPSQSHQAQHDKIPPSPSQPSVLPQVDLFDSELAALNTMRVRDIALQDRGPHSEERQPQVGVGDTLKQDCVESRNGKWMVNLNCFLLTGVVRFRIDDEIMTTTGDSYNPGQNRCGEVTSSASYKSEKLPDVSSDIVQPERSSPMRAEHEDISNVEGLDVSVNTDTLGTDDETIQSQLVPQFDNLFDEVTTETSHTVTAYEGQNRPGDWWHASDQPMRTQYVTTKSPDSSFTGLKDSQSIPEKGKDDFADQYSSKGHEGNVAPSKRGHNEEQPAQLEGDDLRSNRPLVSSVPELAGSVIRKPARRCRRKDQGKRKRKNRAPSPEDFDSDDPDNSDDDDYEDITEEPYASYDATKRKRRVHTAHNEQPDVRSQGGSPVGNISLPDLSTITRGVLTCEIFPSEFVYSFSWKEERDLSDHRPPNESSIRWEPNPGTYDTNPAQVSTSKASMKVKNTNTQFSNEEKNLLKRLKEVYQLEWKKIKEYFPGRTIGALQVHYCTKVKNQPFAGPISPESENVDAGYSPSSEAGQRKNARHSEQGTPQPSVRSRYGLPRSRRPVIRYSP